MEKALTLSQELELLPITDHSGILSLRHHCNCRWQLESYILLTRMLLHMKINFFMMVCMLALLQACVNGKAPSVDREIAVKQTKPDLFQERQQHLLDRNPTIDSHFGKLELVVRLATPAELPEDKSKEGLYGSAIGAGSLALGLGAPPLYASSLVVGGVILVPLGAYLYFHDKGIWNSINGALSNVEWTRAIENDVRSRLINGFPAEPIPEMNVEVVIDSFGLVKLSSDLQNCLVVTAHIILKRSNRELKRDPLFITPLGKSDDAPPPQCAGIERFAENDAQLVKDTLREYAGVLAAMVTGRIAREISK